LTRPDERPLIQTAKGLRFLVLDELHTYRGRQGADVAMLVRRAREAFSSDGLQCVGTSATLAGEGDFEEQRQEIARVASRLFGDKVYPEHVIGETICRITPEVDTSSQEFIKDLRARLSQAEEEPLKSYQELCNDPLSIWIESALEITKEDGTGRLVRCPPGSIYGDQGAARKLSSLTGVPEERCAAAIEKQLLASYECARNPETEDTIFAFQLHQFIGTRYTLPLSLKTSAT